MFGEFLIFSAILLFLFVFFKWATHKNGYFMQKNMKHMKPRFFFGNTGGIILNKYTAAEFAQKLYTFSDEP